MYKILLKYTSTFKTMFWESYMTTNENGDDVEFATENIETLKEEIKKINKEYDFDSIRVVKDVTCEVIINVDDKLESIETITEEEVTNIYKAAFDNVFGGE